MHLITALLGKTNLFYFLDVSSQCGDFSISCGSSLIGWTCGYVSLVFPVLFYKDLFIFLFHFSFHISVFGLVIFYFKSLFLLITGKKTKSIHVHDITSLYSIKEEIDKFLHGVKFSSEGRERGVIMEPRLEDKGFDSIFLFSNRVFLLLVMSPFSSYPECMGYMLRAF